MKHSKQLLLLAAMFSFCACTNNTSTTSKQKVEPKAEKAEYAKATKSDDCIAPKSWFKTVNGNRVTPAPNEGPTSVFANNKTVTNCDFHQWSWQKFLWLTNESNGKPLFMDKLIQVDANGKKLPQDQGILLTAKGQASSPTDILKTPTTPSSTVYYSIFMDDKLYNTMVKYGPIAKKDPAMVKDLTFPVGALEVKASWIDANALADKSSYFVTNGEINGVKTQVALLGIHVVGVVENHPEFVWATFEHENLAPKYDWSKATATTDAPVTSKVDYPFFSKNATATVKNITSGNGIYTNIFSVYEYGVPVKKNTSNQKVFMETSQSESENFDNISMINKSVKNQLTGVWNNYFYNGSIWLDTEGYETTKDQAELLNSLSYNMSNSKPGDLTRGSVAAYNITMETYVQVGFAPKSIHQTTVNDLVNCFSCHNTSFNSNLSPLYISHAFTGYVNHLQGLNDVQNKNDHVEEIIEHFRLRSQKNK